VDGPGQRHTVYTEAHVTRRGTELIRRVVYAEADGHPVAPARLARMERRRAHALGAGGSWTLPEALDVLDGVAAAGPARTTMHRGRPAWEVPVAEDGARGPRRRFDRGTLWFERDPALRLVAARFERRLPGGGRASLDAEFTRVAGLDLPLRHTADADVRQRRRTRWFAVLVRTDVEYSEWSLRRRESPGRPRDPR
jgi:hypothetical protein